VDACNADATCKACQETDYTKCGANALYQALCACAAGDGGACVNQCKTYCGG